MTTTQTKTPSAPQTIFSDIPEEGNLHQRRVSVASTTSEDVVPPIHQHERRSSVASIIPERTTHLPQRRMTLSAWPVNSGMPLRWWETGKDENAIHVAMDHVQFGL